MPQTNRTSDDIREQRAQLIANAKVIVDGADARDLTPDEQTQVDEMFGQADALEQEANSVSLKEKLARAEAGLKQSQGRKIPATARLSDRTQLDRRAAGEFMRQWAIAGAPGHRPNADAMLRAAEHGFDLSSQVMEYRALSKGTTTAGGFTVPQSFSDQLEKILSYYWTVQEAVEVFATEDARDYPWPTVDDTSNSSGIVTEASGIGVATDPTFGQITYKSWDYYSPIVKVSNQLLRDSARDIPSLLAELFAERMGRALDTAIVSANAGTAAPEGMLNGVTVGTTLADGNALTVAKLMALETSVPLAYRNLPGVGFVMHDATWQAIRALEDDDGRQLFNNGNIQIGATKQLLGYPVFLSNSLTSSSSPGDNAPLILFGALNKYKVRRVGGSTLTRLNELYAGNGQVGFLLHEAYDGRWITKAGVRTLNSFDAA